jgi:hypothetical protein
MSLTNVIAVLTENKDTLFDTQESADLIGKSKPWFERHRWAGTGPRYWKIGRTPYYAGEDLLSFIQSTETEVDAA